MFSSLASSPVNLSRLFCALNSSALSSPGVCFFNFNSSTVNSPSLSSFPATPTDRVKVNPFVCHSCKKHPGWGPHPSNQIFPFPSPTTRYSPLSANSFAIRTSAKCAPNSFRMRTSKNQDLKPFRIRTYKKAGEGPPTMLSFTVGQPILAVLISSVFNLSGSSLRRSAVSASLRYPYSPLRLSIVSCRLSTPVWRWTWRQIAATLLATRRVSPRRIPPPQPTGRIYVEVPKSSVSLTKDKTKASKK